MPFHAHSQNHYDTSGNNINIKVQTITPRLSESQIKKTKQRLAKEGNWEDYCMLSLQSKANSDGWNSEYEFLLPYALILANRYDDGAACYEVYCLTKRFYEDNNMPMDDGTIRFLVHYLSKGGTLGNEDCPKALHALGEKECLHYDFLDFIPDSTKNTEISQWLLKIVLVNEYLPMICDTSYYSINARRYRTSSYISQQRRGVDYARRIESLFYDIPPSSTITKEGLYYVLSSEDMEQIHNLYAIWWRKILSCSDIIELEKALSSHPLKDSPYKWEQSKSCNAR